MTLTLLDELAKVKAQFQLQAICTAMGIDSKIELVEPCETCGDHDCVGGLPCITGDGQ
jgi:hypothetical protein